MHLDRLQRVGLERTPTLCLQIVNRKRIALARLLAALGMVIGRNNRDVPCADQHSLRSVLLGEHQANDCSIVKVLLRGFVERCHVSSIACCGWLSSGWVEFCIFNYSSCSSPTSSSPNSQVISG